MRTCSAAVPMTTKDGSGPMSVTTTSPSSGPKGSPQRRLRAAALRRMEKTALLVSPHFQEHGTGAHLPHQPAEVPHPGPNSRIPAHQRSRFTHYYFYIRDE